MTPRVYRFLVRLCGDPELAKDLAQETLARGWQKRHSLREPSALPTWLFRIAVRSWSNHIAKSEQQRTVEINDDTKLPDCPRAGPELHSQAAELGERLCEAMDRLPARQKQVMHLRVIEQMEMNEIAEAIGITEKSVRSNLFAARKRLKSEMDLFEPKMKEQYE